MLLSVHFSTFAFEKTFSEAGHKFIFEKNILSCCRKIVLTRVCKADKSLSQSVINSLVNPLSLLLLL